MYIINTIPHGKCFVRYLRTRCFCTRNLTRSLRSLVRFLIRQQLVRKYRTPALSMKYSLFKLLLFIIIIHQTHYEKSDWSRAFNQFTIGRELDMIYAISAADIACIMSSSTSASLPRPLECSPQKQNSWTLRFCFWGWIMSIFLFQCILYSDKGFIIVF